MIKKRARIAYLIILITIQNLTIQKQPTSTKFQLCDPESMNSPLNIQNQNLHYKDFTVNFDFITSPSLNLKKLPDGILEADNDFGVVNLHGDYFSLNRVQFLRESENQIEGKKYPLELQIFGNDNLNRKIVVSVLFEESKYDNPTLLRLGFGNGRLKNFIQQGKEGKRRRIKRSFNLDEFIGPGNNFLRYEASSTQYPCGEATWLVMYRTLSISHKQLKEIPKIMRYSVNNLGNEKKVKVYQNVKPSLSTINMPKNANKRERIFTNLILDGYKKDYKFNFNPNFSAETDIMKSREIAKKMLSEAEVKEKVETQQTVKEQDEIKEEAKQQRKKELVAKQKVSNMFNRFEIYYPKYGDKWGIVPADAVFPWETRARRRDTDKKFLMKSKVKLPLPDVKGYHYIVLFYGKTSNHFKFNDGRFAYIPYVVLVKDKVEEMTMPTSVLTIFNQNSRSEQKCLITRLKKHDDVKKILQEKSASGMDLIEKMQRMTSVGSNTKSGGKAKMMAQKEEKVEPIEPDYSGLTNREIEYHEELDIMKKQKEFKKLMKKIEKNDRRMRQHKRVLKKGQKMPRNGGYIIHMKKPKSANQKKIKRLHNILGGLRADGFETAINTATSTFPLISAKPGMIPIDAFLVNQKLPKNSVILKINVPIAPVDDSKYIVYFYAPVKYKTRKGERVFIPNYLLVPGDFGISVHDSAPYPLRIPVYMSNKGEWIGSKVTKFRMGRISLRFKKLAVDASVLKLPDHESGMFLNQVDFDLLIWKNNRPRQSKKVRAKKNKEMIINMLKELGSKIEDKRDKEEETTWEDLEEKVHNDLKHRKKKSQFTIETFHQME